MRRGILLAAFILSVCAAWFWLAPPHWFREAFLTETAVRADRLFQREDPNYSADIHHLAQRIEWGDALTPDDFAPVKDRIDQKHGNDITLLFQAVASGNVVAVDALLAAGADPYLVAKSGRSTSNFVRLLMMPGGELLDIDGINKMIASYLRYGGDPNATSGEPSGYQRNLMNGVATSGNISGLRLLLAAGGDPWKPSINNNEPYYSAFETLASDYQFAALDEFIDEGRFDGIPQERLYKFFVNLSGYAQRRDEKSSEIQRIAKRVLKRNPSYIETATYDIATLRIFKDHWEDPLPGMIPWDEILSDAVK